MCGGFLSSPCQEDHLVVHGPVKWFNADQGFGFITQDNGPDVFSQYSESPDATGYNLLKQGDRVIFEITQGPKGPQATSVKKDPTPLC
jgi:CspA family cold shock protein